MKINLRNRALIDIRRNNHFIHELIKNRTLFLMVAPAIIFFTVFNYLPMVGIYYAFTNYNMRGGLFGSPFVGLKNFEFLFSSGTLLNITKNTVLYNLVFMATANFLEISFAVMLSEITSRIYKKVAQTIMLLPHFISMVLVAVFAYNLLNYKTGVINSVLTSLGYEPYAFYNEPSAWKYILVIVHNWKHVGYGSIVYLATITSISDEYYEAAKIDGANIFQRIFKITLPMITPTFIILMLLRIGHILNGQFDMFYQLIGGNSILRDATDIIDTYVFRALVANFDIGMGTAAGLYQSFFGFCLVMLSNFLVKKYNEEYSLF